jgi:hypothetical protein
MKKNTKTLFLIGVCIYLYSFSVFARSINSVESNGFLRDSVNISSNSFRKGHSKQEIITIARGNRPMPSNYLKSRYIRRHLRKFKRGASFLIPENILDKYGRNILGRNDGQFVMAKKEMNALLDKAHGEIAIIELELGIPAGLWKNNRLVRIDIPKPKRLHIRIPSGNEMGANELWIPGGKLPNGYSETVIDPIPQGKYRETVVIKQ